MDNDAIKYLFSLALWLAGLGHFIILIASVQVPSRLGWKQDFSQLSNFNRKVVYTYAGYVMGMILALGILTLTLHDQLLRGTPAALGLAILAAAFWLARILIDFFYFGHEDWPKGKSFKIGHFLLTFLFICLATTYIGLVVWHLSS